MSDSNTGASAYETQFAGAVQKHELEQVDARRERVHGVPPPAGGAAAPNPLEKDLVGLAFSGGGIRSATFNLGILQALAGLKLITRVDYLSAVSGGGYIAGWLAAWIRREADIPRPQAGEADRPEAAVHNVQRQLAPSRLEQAEAHRVPPRRGPQAAEPEPIHHLRAYSRYLSPRFGPLSLDSWALVALYLRNLLANVLTFLFAAATLALVCRLLICLNQLPRPGEQWGLVVLSAIGLLLLVGQLIYRWFLADVRIRGRLRPRAAPDPAAGTASATESGTQVFFGVCLPCACAGVLAVWLFGIDPVPDHHEHGGHTRLPERLRWSASPRPHWPERFDKPFQFVGVSDGGRHLNARGEYVAFGLGFGLFGLVMFVLGNGLERWRSAGPAVRSWAEWWRMLQASGAFGFVFGFLFCAIQNNLLEPAYGSTCAVAFGVPLFLAALVVGGCVDSIACGAALSEYEREWRTRVGAMMLRLGAVWAGVFAVVVYLPWAVESWSASIWAATVWAVGSVAVYAAQKLLGGSVGATGPGLWARFGRWVLLVVPPLLLAGVLGLVSYLIQDLPEVGPLRGSFLEKVNGGAPAVSGVEYLGPVAGWLFIVAGLGVGYSYLVHPNLFSLHSVYGNRLIRCYLGASRRKAAWTAPPPGRPPEDRSHGAPTGVNDAPRRGNTFTGFSPRDDFSLLWLRTDPTGYPAVDGTDQEPWKLDRTPYTGPYPLFNTTLNLVSGEELAYQDRKGESFVLTPDYCGSAATGYARVVPHEGGADVKDPRALSLGRAITISGAAIDPNMRNYQSAGLTALLSVLNFRLGWWLQNPWTVDRAHPRRRAWAADGPSSASYLWFEAIGRTRADLDYVHLSDGGHFENTGAYELIRRRCRYVIVVDAAEDPADASENLANLIRLVRTDFGIGIDIDTSPLRPDAAGLSRWHCAIGAIRYDEVDRAGVTGTLVFVRASLTGDESADVRNYAATHPAFPHNSTANQFFDEDLFESYRALGLHIGTAVFSGAKETVGEPPTGTDVSYRDFNRRFFAAVRRAWAPLPDGATDGYARSCRDYLQAVGQLRDQTGLRRISRSLFPEAGAAPGTVNAPAGMSDGDLTDLHGVDYLLQVMELAWLENDLDQFHAHPLNRGWMNVLRRWTTSGEFYRFWPILRGQYSRGFVRFCEVALNLSPLPVQWCRITDPAAQPWPPILSQFDQEFAKEWAGMQALLSAGTSVPLAHYPSTAVRRAVPTAAGEKGALAWVLTAGPPGGRSGALATWPTGAYPLGLVVAFSPAAAGQSGEWELLVWVRGAYRTLGLGRESLPALLAEIEADPGAREIATLFVRYPTVGTTGGDLLQRTMWTWFFNDNDFQGDQRIGEPPPCVRLSRPLRHPGAVSRAPAAPAGPEPAGNEHPRAGDAPPV